jgi:hypothetical protein
MISQGVHRLTEAQQGLSLNVAVIVLWTALFGLSGLSRPAKWDT